MTDYDATIANLKLAALRELQVRANPPFAIAPGDKGHFYEATLNKIIGPFAEKLMAALIDRDNWRRSSESLAAELDAAHREVDGLKEDLELERLGYGKNSRMTEALAAS